MRAREIMKAWGFDYKTQLVWDKGSPGLGLVFRNEHEVLLYGTKGDMPGPQYQPRSVQHYPKGDHSAKPPEIRRRELQAQAKLPSGEWTQHLSISEVNGVRYLEAGRGELTPAR